MLIAVSSAQGGGKTTTLNELNKLGYKIIERKTSRSILADWNVTLQEVNTNAELTLKFQEEILKRKQLDEYPATLSHSHDICFTERTFLDLAVYTTFAVGHLNQYSEWLDDYYERCVQCSQTYDLIFYLRAGHFAPVGDGVRGTNIHYNIMVDLMLEDVLKSSIPSDRLVVVDTPVLSERVHAIKTISDTKFEALNQGK